MSAVPEPSDALIEAITLAIANADGQEWDSLDDAPTRAAFMGYPEMARAAYAAMVEHLGLVEETQDRYLDDDGHRWAAHRRLVSKWEEAQP